jgi:hypothetical protein
MQKCSICKAAKSEKDFYNNKNAKNGKQKHCIACHKIMNTKWIDKNLERKREVNKIAMRKYRKKYPEKIKKQRKKFWLLHGDKYKKISREKNKITRKEIIDKYGGKCDCCGINDYRFLCLDHKNNDGYKARKYIRAGFGLHKWIKKNNYPDSIRVLCFNCNFGRAFYGGIEKICPHKLK